MGKKMQKIVFFSLGVAVKWWFCSERGVLLTVILLGARAV